MLNDKKFILVSSWQDISYSIYLIKKKNFEEINLIFFDKNIYNFFKKQIKLSCRILYIFVDVPYINLKFGFINIFRILFFPICLFFFKIKLKKKFNIFNKIIYTFGNEIAFKNAIFLNYCKFNKIYSFDILQLKKNLQNKKNILHTKFLSNISINRLKFIWHFLYYNILSGSNYRFWYNGNIYRYFKWRNFKNEIYLSSKFFNNNNFVKSIDTVVRKKTDKKSIIIIFGDNSDDIEKFEKNLYFFFELLKKKRLTKFNIYFKFHPDLSEKNLTLVKNKINSLKLKYLVKKVFNFEKDIPLELINLKPLYYIGYDSGAFRFLNPIKSNIIIKSNKLLHNSYKKIYYKSVKKIQVITEKNIVNKILD